VAEPEETSDPNLAAEPAMTTDPPIVTDPTATTDPSPTTELAEQPAALAETPIASTLIVERDDFPHGVSLGRGEVERLSTGDAMVLGGPRPAIRVVVPTGPLVLSFSTAVDRERAAAEVLEETGLGPDGRRTNTP
jgi:hypothetical protein